MIEQNSQVALVGFMGTGKSTVGALLAETLGCGFLDLDLLLAARAGASIPEIFAREGEAGFRRRERQLLAEVADGTARVLATGGGVVLNPANVAILRRSGVVVALTASLPHIMARVAGDQSRPLLAGDDPAGKAAALLAAREPLYRAAADLAVDTTALTPQEVAAHIAAWYRRARLGKGTLT